MKPVIAAIIPMMRRLNRGMIEWAESVPPGSSVVSGVGVVSRVPKFLVVP